MAVWATAYHFLTNCFIAANIRHLNNCSHTRHRVYLVRTLAVVFIIKKGVLYCTSMRLFFPLLLVITLQNGFAQTQKRPRAKHYFSARPTAVSPLGFLDDTYYSGAGINGIMHFKWLKKGAEVQVITGYERFKPKGGNSFGAITVVPLKMGLLQKISKEFFVFGRTGVVAVKDMKTQFSIRFATDAGLGFAFKKIAVDIAIHGWVRKNGGGFTNYFSAGVVLPFRRSD